MLYYIGGFLLITSLVVIIHEYGHYFFARLFGVKVENFSVGFGPEVFGYKDKAQTRWSFRLIPAGGSVKMFGDANPASMPDEDKIRNFTKDELDQSLHAKKTYQKILVALGGPLFNFVSAIAIMSFIFFCYGKTVSPPIIESIAENSPAQVSGLMEGDVITSIDSQKVHSFDDIRKIVALLSPKETVDLTYLRDDTPQLVSITPELILTEDHLGNSIRLNSIGITTEIGHEMPSFFDAVCYSFTESWSMFMMTGQVLKKVISGKRDMDDMGGPVKIIKYSGQSMQKGFLHFMWLVAALSVNLAFVNLLPIPVLDGGHIFFYTIEAIIGRPINSKFLDYAFKFGVVFLIFTFVIFTFNDIKSLIQ